MATLRRVADAIERKEPVRIQVAGKRLLAPATAILSIEHELDGANEELELQLRWQAASDDQQPAKPSKRNAPKRRKAARTSRG